jgi:hypothetical protein
MGEWCTKSSRERADQEEEIKGQKSEIGCLQNTTDLQGLATALLAIDPLEIPKSSASSHGEICADSLAARIWAKRVQDL